MAIYIPLEVSAIPTALYDLRSESSIDFELLTEFMLTDVVERRCVWELKLADCSWT
jgi:hypothetical protein